MGNKYEHYFVVKKSLWCFSGYSSDKSPLLLEHDEGLIS